MVTYMQNRGEGYPICSKVCRAMHRNFKLVTLRHIIIIGVYEQLKTVIQLSHIRELVIFKKVRNSRVNLYLSKLKLKISKRETAP